MCNSLARRSAVALCFVILLSSCCFSTAREERQADIPVWEQPTLKQYEWLKGLLKGRFILNLADASGCTVADMKGFGCDKFANEIKHSEKMVDALGLFLTYLVARDDYAAIVKEILLHLSNTRSDKALKYILEICDSHR